MLYRQFTPAAELAPFIACYWHLRGTPEPGTVERILPDGSAELVLNLRAPFRRIQPDGERLIQPRALLIGQIPRYLLLEPAGDIEVFAVRFTPAGVAGFFSFGQDEIADEYAPLDALGRPWSDLEESLQLTSSLAGRVHLLNRTLLAQRRHAPSPRVARAVARLRETRGRLRIESLARELAVSERQLERDFRSRVGLSPKHFARVVRFQHIFRALQQRDPAWADVAADCGYSDQAHLANEFRTLSGLAPTEYFRQATAMGSAFLG